MLKLAILLVAAAVAMAIVPAPTFPTDWTAQEEDEIAIAQGSSPGPDGAMCCPAKSNCKVQTEYQAGTTYWSGTLNATRFDGGGQIIVTDYRVLKQMLVSANLTCLEYCPTEEDSLDPSPFWADSDDAKDVKDLGDATINGVKCRHYQWFEKIAHIIKMQQTDMYIQLPSAAGETAVPVQENDIIEPFGQPLGTESSSWTNFQAGADASLFKVIGIASCPESSNCGQSSLQHRRLRDKAFKSFARYHKQ